MTKISCLFRDIREYENDFVIIGVFTTPSVARLFY